MISQQSSPEVPVGAGRRDQRWRVAVVCLVLAAITFAVFGQTLFHEFIDFDDNDYVYNNPVVERGLTRKGILWAFTGVHAANWHPLTWLSHELDCQLYGLHPGGHHLTNVLLHTATVIALFLVLRQMTGALWRSAFVAGVFAIHPLRVESVAWVAERKDVLSGLFFMLTIGAYVRYARRPWSWGRYGLVMLLFAMGLMCKPMLVTLPVVLLLLDYWPLQRVQPRKLSGLVLEKLPLLALSAAGCIVTLLAQTKAIQSIGSFSLPMRLANALVACMVYLGQMVWPAGLAVLYPYPHDGLPTWKVALAGMLLAGLSAVAWGQRRKQPWLLIGWLWYLVMLLPVVGIIQVGDQAHADRYTYLPAIGLVMAGTWWAANWSLGWTHRRAVLGCLMAAVMGAFMVCAWKQTAYWVDSETLWIRTLACTTNNYVAHYCIGSALSQKDKLDEAISHYQKALQINPGYAEALNNLGSALLQKGGVDEAISHYQQALQINPGYAKAHYNLGSALLQKGGVDEAIAQFQQALRINPDYAEARINLGSALLQKGRVEEAITQFQQALQINPGCAEAHNNLGNILLQQGSVDEAIDHFQKALQIKPNYADACNNLGRALRRKGKVDEAIAQYQKALQVIPDDVDARVSLGTILLQEGKVDEAIMHYEKALQIKPHDAETHCRLGTALSKKGRADEAVSQYQMALQIEPADVEAQNNLAWLLATCPQASLRNGDKAVDLARQANGLTGGENPIILRTLAAAFAEAGRFPEAVETAQRAVHLAEAQSNARLAGQLRFEMNLYQAGNPFHLPAQTH